MYIYKHMCVYRVKLRVKVRALRLTRNSVTRLMNTTITMHRRFIYKGDTSTHAQGTDPRMALGAQGDLP